MASSALPHDEEQYLALVRDVLATGSPRPTLGTQAKFGAQCRYRLHDPYLDTPVLPLFTTKFVSFRNVWAELLFFIHGKSHVQWLHHRRCAIWDANSSRAYLDAVGLAHYPEGQLGPVYGAQWRHWGGRYLGADAVTGDSCYDEQQPGWDQLQHVVDQLKQHPESRRHVVVAWNPTDLPRMALPPCHVLFQFFAETDAQGQRWLSCQMYQRSCDLGLGVPYNVASYALLTHLVAHLTGLRAKEFVHVLGDYHIYTQHREALAVQVQRTPYRFTSLQIRKSLATWQELDWDDVVLGPYQAHPALKMPLVV